MNKTFFGLVCILSLCISLSSPAAFASHPTLLSNCNDFKLETGDYTRRVDALVGQVEKLIASDAQLLEAVKKGNDITQAIYAAGLINKVLDCNENAANPNIQIVGGDPINNTRGKSFTLILRAINSPHCRAIDAGISRVGRTVRKRPEIPNKPEGPWGECLNNPITWGLTLGKNLPMPNVAYINVEVDLSASNASYSCQLRQFSNECSLWGLGKATAQQESQCLVLAQDVIDANNKVVELNNKQQLASLSTSEREALLAGLLKSPVIPDQIPYSDVIRKSRLNAAELIYKSGANNNIDSQYWTSELNKYDRISDRIYEKACKNGWQHLFKNSFSWTTLFGSKREDIIMQILAEFQSVIPISLSGKQVYFEDISLLSRIMNQNLREAYYVPPILPKNDALYPWRDSIVLTNWSYQTRLAIPVGFSDFIRIFLEEMMHAHQRELWEDNLAQGKLPKDPSACYQAHLFMYNAALYSSASGAYENQPLELHAKQFSEYVRSSLFADQRACP